VSTIRITDDARKWLLEHGSDLTLRAATRNGCCGGRAGVPVAEARVPDDLSAFEARKMDGVRVYVATSLLGVPLLVDLEGLGPWKRLIVEGSIQPFVK
jgi:hypothetical protein